MELTGKQRRYLRSLAHHIDPVVIVGQGGVSAGVYDKIDVELDRHELIKVKFSQDAPTGPKEVGESLAARLGAAVAQIIGGMLVLYRPRVEDPEIVLPRA